MTLLAEASTLEELYSAHFGHGRTALGRMLGGTVEVESDGAWVVDSEGARYLDFGGYGVYLLGHRHPEVTAAVHQQIDRHPMATRVFYEPAAAHAAAELASVTPGDLDLVHFVNSGAEATEAAIKLARANGKTALITTRNGFHGKTMGALSVTANPLYQRPFEPLISEVTTVSYGDIQELEVALSAVAGRGCFIVEPVQGEAGVNIPPAGYLREAADLCQRYDALLVVDEIQTGLGRLGSWWGIDQAGVVPDMLLVGKGLSGGVIPVAALVARPTVYAPFARDPYLHTSTFAGAPVACAAASATIKAMRAGRLPERAAIIGRTLAEGLARALEQQAPSHKVELRARGLLIGLEFEEPGLVGELFLGLVERGVLANHSLNNPTVLRFTPPAILSESEIGHFLEIFASALAELPAPAIARSK
ncbi:aspartate aminotransferase family protein [Nocardia tengchongensis]|uniref:aspartate aminotransferase family protein n=1 Tax=Nocardia tengchongensis TaxID=2055889 RepID=UPI0036A1F470